MSKLFFDTETTGLPDFKRAPGQGQQPNICQLAAILTDEVGNTKAEINFLIKPEGWVIPPELTKIHGISTETADLYGLSIKGVLSIFSRLLGRADQLIAHNIKFDLFMVDVERFKSGVDVDFSPLTKFCTMTEATGIVQCPPSERMKAAGMTGYKSPNLGETYRHFFGRDLEGAHDAMVDVRACKDIYFAMQKAAT